MENGKKSAAENLGQMFKEFGSAIAEIFNDPELKAKSKDFAESAAQSARAFAARFKDEDVKERFREVGKAAQNLGKNVSDYFKTEKENDTGKENSQPAQENSVEGGKDLTEEADGDRNDTGKENISYTEAPLSPKKPFGKKFDAYFSSSKPARITGYVFGAIFAIAWMIFVLFFNNYIAYYYTETQGAITQLQIVPILTSGFNAWLPVFTLSILIAIIGNLILAFFERFFLVKIVSIIISGTMLSATAYLLRLFPFDFSQIPSLALRGSANMITTITLIIIMAACGVAIIVDFVKLIVFFARNGTFND